MRCIIVVLGLLVAITLGLLGIIHSRRAMALQMTKTSYFGNVKHKVTSDVLKEFQSNIAEGNMRLDQAKKQLEKLLTEVKAAQEVADGKNAELNTCNSELNQIKAEINPIDAEQNKIHTEFQQNKVSLQEQINNLKTESEKRSKMCDYIIKSSVEGMKLCGIVLVLPAEQKPASLQAA